MTMYAGDEFYDDDTTSGLIGGDSDLWDEDDNPDYDMSGEFDDVAQGRWDYD